MLNRIDGLAAFVVLGVTLLAGCTGAELNEAKPAPRRGSSFDTAAAVSNNAALRGRLDGIWFWTIPTTPNGLVPTESWSGAASAPGDDVYVAGMDHATNSALYRLHGDILSYLGDAKSASAAAENWRDGETAQKFHVRPVWHNGRVYVATYGSSTLDATYLSLRGFHWYAYDVGTDRLIDLSAKQPGGTGVPHGGVIAQVVDPANDRIYAAVGPTGDLYRYDIASGEGTLLGHPDYQPVDEVGWF